jgi:hypothetical protein
MTRNLCVRSLSPPHLLCLVADRFLAIAERPRPLPLGRHRPSGHQGAQPAQRAHSESLTVAHSPRTCRHSSQLGSQESAPTSCRARSFYREATSPADDIVLADFSCALDVDGPDSLMRGEAGSPGYVSPEVRAQLDSASCCADGPTDGRRQVLYHADRRASPAPPCWTVLTSKLGMVAGHHMLRGAHRTQPVQEQRRGRAAERGPRPRNSVPGQVSGVNPERATER